MEQSDWLILVIRPLMNQLKTTGSIKEDPTLELFFFFFLSFSANLTCLFHPSTRGNPAISRQAFPLPRCPKNEVVLILVALQIKRDSKSIVK